jgi:hypothetical protein
MSPGGEEQSSPEQIAGRCEKEGRSMMNHERIHQLIRRLETNCH